VKAARYNGHAASDLLLPEDAVQALLLRYDLPSPPIERVGLAAARGRVLAAPLVAGEPVPCRARSAMDGYAIRLVDVAAGRPLQAVVGQRTARAASAAIRRGQAIRVATGGLVPPGADSVVPSEFVDLADGFVRIVQSVGSGDNIVPAGSDVRAGELLLAAGSRLRSADVGFFAAMGREDVEVYRRPVVGIVSTGDEVVVPGKRARVWETFDVNRYTLGATLVGWGAVAHPLPNVGDDARALARVLRMALSHCDALVLSGGSSVGEHDMTAEAIDSLGFPGVVVHGVKMKPGRPAILASVDGKPIIGLPGSPTAALIASWIIVAPIVRALAGQTTCDPLPEYTTAEPIHGKPGWECFVPVSVREGSCWPVPMSSSHISTFSRAAGFVRVPHSFGVIPSGTAAQVQMIT
jgi:molybdenum cofactor synthesis domain-containing protein